MFAGFKVRLNKDFFENQSHNFDYYKKIGINQINQYKAECDDILTKFIIEKDILDGSSLQQNWFPEIKADIFLSHSHIDEDLALALSGWLYDNFKISSFIDSVVWGYADDLRETLNTKYSDKRVSKDGGYLYSHTSCNRVSQHIDMMLNIALHRMIDSTEAIFLLNTPNAIAKFESDPDSRTYSPWLYSEIVCTEIIRKKLLSEYRPTTVLEHSQMSEDRVQNSLNIAYKVDTKHLITINKHHLQKWLEEAKPMFPLDTLYQQHNLLEKNKGSNIYG